MGGAVAEVDSIDVADVVPVVGPPAEDVVGLERNENPDAEGRSAANAAGDACADPGELAAMKPNADPPVAGPALPFPCTCGAVVSAALTDNPLNNAPPPPIPLLLGASDPPFGVDGLGFLPPHTDENILKD